MCFARPLSKEKTHESYVKMQPAGPKIMAGDVILLEGDEIIGVIGGLKFQAIPRSLLNIFLPPAGGSNRTIAPANLLAKPSLQVKTERKVVSVVESSWSQASEPNISSRALNVVAEEVRVPTLELPGNVVIDW